MSTPRTAPNSTDSRPIGVFDSGVGGLTVLNKLVERFPNERFVYFGDTLHMPYGEKSLVTIETLVRGTLGWLQGEHNAKLVVVACNTSAGLPTVFEQASAVPWVDPMTPLCQVLVVGGVTPRYRKIGVLATPATVASGRYQTLLQSLNPAIEVRQVACPGLASLVEQGRAEAPETRQLLQGFLQPLVEWGVEAVILGCTHYPFACAVIAELLPADVALLDPADAMGERVAELLVEMPAPAEQGGVDYHVSARNDDFLAVAAHLPLANLRISLPQVTVVNPLVLSDPAAR